MLADDGLHRYRFEGMLTLTPDLATTPWGEPSCMLQIALGGEDNGWWSPPDEPGAMPLWIAGEGEPPKLPADEAAPPSGTLYGRVQVTAFETGSVELQVRRLDQEGADGIRLTLSEGLPGGPADVGGDMTPLWLEAWPAEEESGPIRRPLRRWPVPGLRYARVDDDGKPVWTEWHTWNLSGWPVTPGADVRVPVVSWERCQ